MKLSRRKHTHTSAMNMTPMIDIVFLLLIFFMTVSQVSEIQKEQMQLPELEGALDQEPAKLIVNVDEQGVYRVSGQEVSKARLMSLVSEELARVGDDPHRLQVVVRGDRRGDSRGVNEVVRSLARLQIKKINIAVQRAQ